MIENVKKPLVYFGRLAESKGIELTIEAVYIIYMQYPASASPLWIIGGNYTEISTLKGSLRLKNKIEELEANNLIFWWGHLPHGVLPFILRKCYLFCFTSRYEPGGRTILEAMASRLPVLATPQGFAEQVIQDGINGYILVNDSPDEWAKVIHSFLIDCDKQKRMGDAAFETIRKSYSMQDFFERHWDVYMHAIQEYNSQPQKD